MNLNPSQNHDLRLSEKYVQMKAELYIKMFKASISVFMTFPILQFFKSQAIENFENFIPSLLATACLISVSLILLKLKLNQELIITMYFIFLHTFCQFLFYKWDPEIYNNASNSYYLGYISGLYEAATANRIPKFSYRTSYRIILLMLRFFLVLPEDNSLLILQFGCYGYNIYLDYIQELQDQSLFESNFYSKEQLNKFKELMVHDIPESIAVFTQNLSECLFANNAFKELGEEADSNSLLHLRAFLKRFVLYELPESNSRLSTESSLGSLPSPKETLLHLIQKFINRETLLRQHKPKFNLRFTSSEGSSSTFEAKLVSIFWDGRPAIALILHDITQQDTIIRLKMSANLQKDRILATVSHELRTPLNSILGMIEMAQQKIQDSEALQYLKICSNSGNLLLGLVNSILDLNLIRANKLKLYTENIHFAEFLRSITQLFEFQCKFKGIYLKLALSALVPKHITTDKNRLSQILINLIGNALKFTDKGGILLTVNPCSHNPENLEISVQDTGLGIKKQDQDKLFQIFGKIEEEQTRAVNTQGVGLGLTISNNLAKLLSGDASNSQGISLESEEGKGSKFSFAITKNLNFKKMTQIQDHSYEDLLTEYITEHRKTPALDEFFSFSPLKKPNDSSSPIANSPYNKKYPLSSQTFRSRCFFKQDPSSYILVIDDNPLNLKVIEYFVLRQQYQVKTALSGQSAIDIMVNNNHEIHPVKLILMDLQMPVMDGYETAKVLKELMDQGKVPEIPIVALTANDSEDDRKACKDVGMNGFLTKPLKEKDFIHIIETLVQT